MTMLDSAGQMAHNEAIEISDSESDAHSYGHLRAVFEPIVRRVVGALGGFENGRYRLGDEVLGCLKDLKILWRKDDVDDERTIARLFWEARVLPNDLVPILLETAGKGLVEDKRAIYCADLITAMTWPIDIAEELKELDEELDKGTDYTQLLQSHLHYKAALLQPGVIGALLGIMLAPLSKPPKDRCERDGQVVNVVLHLIRNLAFIKDLPTNIHLSSDQAELSSLQSRLIRAIGDTHILPLLLTIAANSDNDPLFNGWNTLVLEILYLLFRGVKPSSIVVDQAKHPAANLHRLLAIEERNRREVAHTASSRHSRFGTTISVMLNPNKKYRDNDASDASSGQSAGAGGRSQPIVLHRQQAISQESGGVMDMTKQQKYRKGKTVDELAREDCLSFEARNVIKDLAKDFIEGCFNSFLASLIKDIRSERAKVTEKDNLRLLFVTKWFLHFFLSMRWKEKDKASLEQWGFGLVAEVMEREWIVWVLKRMRGAVDEKPKLWTELQAGIECLTQLLLLIDEMTSSDIMDPTLREAAEILQQQIIYNGEVLDIALDSLRSYKDGTQSLAYLDSSVYLAYALLKTLEKWSKSSGKEVYVRKKKKRSKAKDPGEGDIADVEEEREEQEDVIHETMFTFDAFEMKFAHADITHTLLTYLSRYNEFVSSEHMKRVVSLMHRQAVRAKAEGLFFKVSTLDLFRSILADQKSFPKEQPYKDLISLINFILRQFFKALAEEPFLAVEAFFPKNRGHWKQYSSWQPEEKTRPDRAITDDQKFPPEVEVKAGYSWSDQLGITIAVLVDADQLDFVHWTKEIIALAIAQRHRIIEETDSDREEQENDEDVPAALNLRTPSNDAIAKFTDYLIPYLSDEHADAASKNPHLKLLFRLSKFCILDDDADELEWYVPAAILPSDLQSTLNVINQFIETPFDPEGQNPTELLRKKRRRRRRVVPADDDDVDRVDNEPNKKRQKKKKEKEEYKSAQFIEDSDAEYGDMEAFLEKEKAMRERAALAAAAAGVGKIGTMKPTGTKKRRRKATDDDSGTNKKRKGTKRTAHSQKPDDSDEVETSDSDTLESRHSTPRAASLPMAQPSAPKPKPRPRLRKASRSDMESSRAMDDPSLELVTGAPSSPNASASLGLGSDPESESLRLSGTDTAGLRKTSRLIVSDEEE